VARLQGLGAFARQIHAQDPIRVVGGFDRDVIGQFEASFEGAAGDPAMQVGAFLFVVSFMAQDEQKVWLGREIQIF
jgi:hypothetical protein